MSSQIAKLTGAWSTDVLPTQTTLTHIDPAAVTGLVESLLSASAAYPTITKNIELYSLARHVKGAKASLSVISAQHYIATATATQNFPEMTSIIWNATMELQDLEKGFNLYQMDLSVSANVIFAVLFAVVLATHTGLFMWKQYVYFGVCFLLGTGLEFAGYVARVMAIDNYSEKGPFLCQIISLTLAPALIMAGIYYLLAQLLVIYGRQFSRLKPLWFSYIFIFCDLSSLFIQAAGGGLAAIRLQNLESTHTGTKVMLSGIAFQVISMTLFLGFLFEFLWKIYFRASADVRFSFPNLFALLFQTPRGRELQNEYLFRNYNQAFSHIWSRRIFGYYPLAIIIGVAFIYIRCVYRLVELQEGWSGYLITHEKYVMTLDGLQVLLTCLLFIPFHPGFIMGKGANVSMSQISHKADEEKMSVDQEKNEANWSVEYDSKSLMPEESWDSSSDLKQDVVPLPINPYYIPRIAVEPPTISSEVGSEVTRPKSITTTDSEKNSSIHTPRKNKWIGFHRGSKSTSDTDGEGIVAIAYDQTMENQPIFEPQTNIPQTPTPSRQKRRSERNSQKITEQTNFEPVNPYTRSVKNGEFGSSGPYELYGTGLERPDLFSTPRSNKGLGHEDVSLSSDDDFLFSFGAMK